MFARLEIVNEDFVRAGRLFAEIVNGAGEFVFPALCLLPTAYSLLRQRDIAFDDRHAATCLVEYCVADVGGKAFQCFDQSQLRIDQDTIPIIRDTDLVVWRLTSDHCPLLFEPSGL